MKNAETLKNLLAVQRNITIITHPRPDGDAMGSSLGLAMYLKLKGHVVTVIYPTEFPDFFKWMSGSRQALIYTHKKDQAVTAMKEADVIFCLDFNTLSRVAPLNKTLEKCTARMVLIDHHLQPELNPNFTWTTRSTSTTIIHKLPSTQNGTCYRMSECVLLLQNVFSRFISLAVSKPCM